MKVSCLTQLPPQKVQCNSAWPMVDHLLQSGWFPLLRKVRPATCLECQGRLGWDGSSSHCSQDSLGHHPALSKNHLVCLNWLRIYVWSSHHSTSCSSLGLMSHVHTYCLCRKKLSLETLIYLRLTLTQYSSSPVTVSSSGKASECGIGQPQRSKLVHQQWFGVLQPWKEVVAIWESCGLM